MNPVNSYAYQQVLGSMHRRGASVTKSAEDSVLVIQGAFEDLNMAELAWLALSTKYFKEGPMAVEVSRSEDHKILTFKFPAVS